MSMIIALMIWIMVLFTILLMMCCCPKAIKSTKDMFATIALKSSSSSQSALKDPEMPHTEIAHPQMPYSQMPISQMLHPFRPDPQMPYPDMPIQQLPTQIFHSAKAKDDNDHQYIPLQITPYRGEHHCSNHRAIYRHKWPTGSPFPEELSTEDRGTAATKRCSSCIRAFSNPPTLQAAVPPPPPAQSTSTRTASQNRAQPPSAPAALHSFNGLRVSQMNSTGPHSLPTAAPPVLPQSSSHLRLMDAIREGVNLRHISEEQWTLPRRDMREKS